MADKAMKERHWKRIEDITKHKFDIDSDSFVLRNIMDAPLLANIEDIEVCWIIVMCNLFLGLIM